MYIKLPSNGSCLLFIYRQPLLSMTLICMPYLLLITIFLYPHPGLKALDSSKRRDISSPCIQRMFNLASEHTGLQPGFCTHRTFQLPPNSWTVRNEFFKLSDNIHEYNEGYSSVCTPLSFKGVRSARDLNGAGSRFKWNLNNRLRGDFCYMQRF